MFKFDFENWTAHGEVRDPSDRAKLLSIEMRLLGKNDFPELYRLHLLVLGRLPHPHVLRPDSEEFMRRNLRERGVTFGAYAGAKLIAYSVVAFPAPNEPSPADDLPEVVMKPDEVAIYDGSGVHPDYRGNHLHATLNVLRREYARRAGKHHLYGTVSIYNPRSLDNHLSAGLMVKGIREKYGGMMRLIIHQDLRETPTRPSDEVREAKLADVAAHHEALASGQFGWRLVNHHPECVLQYARFLTGKNS